MITTGKPLEHDRVRPLAEFVEAASRPGGGWTIPFPLGEDADQELRFADLADGHVLIAGSTGSGKTRFVQALIASISRTCTPSDVRLLIIDGKGLDLATIFNNLPHNLCDPITDIDEAIETVNWVAHEMDRRRRILREDGTPHIWAYRTAQEAHGLAPDLPALCIVIDEVQALTQTSAEAMRDLTRLSQQGRASGILLVLATQRPTRNVIDPAIKANLPCRVCFRVPSQVDSRVALDRHGAERLRHPGELIAVHPTMNEVMSLTAPYVSDEDLIEVVAPLRLPIRTVAALPPADESSRLLVSFVSGIEQPGGAAPTCNGTLNSKPADNGCSQIADVPKLSPEYDPVAPELTTPTCFAKVILDISTIAERIGHDCDVLSLVYRPTVVLELSRRRRRRYLLIDALSGRLMISDSPPKSIPFLQMFDDLAGIERDLLASAVGSRIPYDDPRASASWSLVELGFFDADSDGFQVCKELNHPPVVRLQIASCPPSIDEVIAMPAQELQHTIWKAHRDVAFLWRPGAIASHLVGFPYWRTRYAGSSIDIPAWSRKTTRSVYYLDSCSLLATTWRGEYGGLMLSPANGLDKTNQS